MLAIVNPNEALQQRLSWQILRVSRWIGCRNGAQVVGTGPSTNCKFSGENFPLGIAARRIWRFLVGHIMRLQSAMAALVGSAALERAPVGSSHLQAVVLTHEVSMIYA
jgi:hypothetical protein